MIIRNIYIIGLITIMFLSCKEKQRSPITDNQLKSVLNIDYAIESYYYNNLKLPESISEMNEFYEESIDSLFINTIEKGKKIVYVPVYIDSIKNPTAYYLVSSNNTPKRVTISNEESFYNSLITVCEYNKGMDGELLLSYSNPYLISSGRVVFDKEEAFVRHWKEKIFYNIVFDIDSTAVLNEKSLDFETKIDSVIVKGTFYNEKVLKKVLSDDNVRLQGFKVKNIGKNEIRLKDVVIKRQDNSDNKYFNEVGTLIDLKKLRGCN